LLALVALLPVWLALTSNGLSGSIPLYSRIRMSGKTAGVLKVKVTALAPAPEAEMFGA
jgi:hypothetical protein